MFWSQNVRTGVGNWRGENVQIFIWNLDGRKRGGTHSSRKKEVSEEASKEANNLMIGEIRSDQTIVKDNV